MCSPRVSPMAEIIVEEFDATSRSSIRVFQTLSAGKIGQPGAPGIVGAPPGFDGGTGWLEALLGFVPARTSVPSW